MTPTQSLQWRVRVGFAPTSLFTLTSPFLGWLGHLDGAHAGPRPFGARARTSVRETKSTGKKKVYDSVS
jgi:hypothetical protein